MSASQKIASKMRKVSQLSSALGVSHVKHSNHCLQNGGQSYQILHTALLKQDVEVIGQNRKSSVVIELKDGEEGAHMEAELDCLPLPAKRWEKRMDMRSGVTLGVVGERRKT